MIRRLDTNNLKKVLHSVSSTPVLYMSAFGKVEDTYFIISNTHHHCTSNVINKPAMLKARAVGHHMEDTIVQGPLIFCLRMPQLTLTSTSGICASTGGR